MGSDSCCFCFQHRDRRSFREEVSYNYCAAKKQTYYGFKGHLMLRANGIITGLSLTSANIDERDALWDLLDSIHGLVIRDKGYIRDPLKAELHDLGIQLETSLRHNMKDRLSMT